MSGYWLLMGLCFACLQSLIVWHIWWLAGFAGWFFVLSWYYFRRWLRCTILILLVSVGIAGWQDFTMIAHQRDMRVTQLLVHPDDIKINGGMVTGTGLTATQAKVYFRWYLATPTQLTSVKTWTQPFVLTGNIETAAPAVKRNRYSFDFRQFLYTKGIYWQATIMNGQAHGVEQQSLVSWIKTLHLLAVRHFEALPSGLRDYGETLFLGYTRATFYEDNVGVEQTGLVHLFSISGFQIMGFYVCWRRFWRWCHVSKETNLWTLQVGLMFIWLFSGEVLSLIRPVLLASMSVFKELGYLKLTLLDAWGLTLIFGLMLEPGVLQNLGGQLSYLLSFGLLWLQRCRYWQISCYLGLLIMPVLIWHNYEWHPMTLPANILIVPLFSMFIVPVVLVGLIASGLDWLPLMNLCNEFVLMCQHAIAWCDQIPGNLIFGQTPLMLLLAFFLGVLYAMAKHRHSIYWVLSIIFGMMVVWPALNPVGHVIFFDVGQGDCTIIKLPGSQQAYLIDVGGKVAFQQASWQNRTHVKNYLAEEIVTNLKGLGVKRIAGLVLTHKDTDHIGDFADMAKLIKIERVYLPAGMETTDVYLKKIQPTHIPVTLITAGAKTDFPVQFLHPFGAGTAENQDSIVSYGHFGRRNFLMTGDLEQAGELAVSKAVPTLRTDVLKFGHHGSKNSTAPDFVATLKPTIGIVSAGMHNRYHHPAPETLRTAADANIQVYNTQTSGMIDYRWTNWSEKWEVQLHGVDATNTQK
ncbi:ComEC/Rec2 family competence protein [Weissella soli]|uniref:ComEC/Rec2 family competence protein n=1 Tax=Weissella soli TaxID=155866 RepID=UPI0035A08071